MPLHGTVAGDPHWFSGWLGRSEYVTDDRESRFVLSADFHPSLVPLQSVLCEALADFAIGG